MERRPDVLALRVRNLSAGYGAVPVLHDIDFDLLPGSAAAILGANGAGKTTFIKALAGVILVNAGSIDMWGRTATGDSPNKRARAGLAVVPEGRGILRGLTVEENLVLGTLNRPSRCVPEALTRAYEMFPRLAEKRSLEAGVLSGGEQQMLAIGRALASDPHVILLDEPSLGLSPKAVDDVYEILQALRSEGRSLVVVEQHTERALQLCDTAYVVELGRIVKSGISADVAQDSALADGYLGAIA